MARSNNPNQLSPLDILKQLTPSPGVGTRVLCILIIVISLMGAIIPESWPWLVIHQETLSGGFLTAIITNCFVAARSGLFSVLLFMAIGIFFFKDLFTFWWIQNRGPLVVALVAPVLALYGIDLLIGGTGVMWGLTVSVLLLFWFAIPIEREWGSQRLLIFCAAVTVVVNIVGAILLATWPDGLSSALTRSARTVTGMSPMNGALIAVWALMLGHQRLMVLNIQAKTLVWVLVIIGVFDFLLVGRIKALMDLAGIGCAWLLVTGYWRPRFLLDRIRLNVLERRVEKRRSRMKVVDDDNPTIH